MRHMATCVIAPSLCPPPPLHLAQIDGPSSSPAIYLRKQTEPVKQPQRTWPRGLVTASLQKPDLLDELERLYSWMEKWILKKIKKNRMKRRKANEKASSSYSLPSPLLSESPSFYLSNSSSFFLSANSIPFQSPSERSKNASSYYITYAVHQSDRVWITPSMTPKSCHYQTLGLHRIGVTTSGSLGWDREPFGKLDWVKTLFM